MAGRLLAIGDIHGCLAQFDALIGAVGLTPSDHLILLGDYVDRGPESAGVLRRIVRLSGTHRLSCIQGNHEEMMMQAREGGQRFREWLLNGGDATMASYGGTRGTIKDVPAEHWRFLETKLVDYVETESHIFVHASAYPDMNMDEQPDFMLRWERCDNIQAHQSGKVIVCGHTPQRDGSPLNMGHAICIDTHACGHGVLTCLEAKSGKVWQADENGRVERSHISDY
ncbi:MAG TPA: metallophosphoesterase family protein [Phycisphaerae bacterium]|nr:metallophosphoesterase family protein [Phycisphaerae bacterium]